MNLIFYFLAGLATIIIVFPVFAISTKNVAYIAAMLFVIAGVFLVGAIYFFPGSMLRNFAWWFLGIAVVCATGGVLILKRKKKKEK